MRPALGLTRVPRLTRLINWVPGAMMALAISIMDRFRITEGGSSRPCPVVIRTWQMNRVETPPWWSLASPGTEPLQNNARPVDSRIQIWDKRTIIFISSTTQHDAARQAVFYCWLM